MYEKMNRFLPPANDWGLENEFECWHPDSTHAYNEKPGNVAWMGKNSVPAIAAATSLPFVDIPKQLQDMVSHCWKKASISPTALHPNRPQIGGARQQAFDNRGLQMGGHREQARMAAAGEYRPMVSPTEPPVPLAHLQGVANDWKVMEALERVNAYTFRGDSRAPGAIKAADGFKPPSSRNDKHYVENAFYPQFASYMKRRFNKTIDKQTFLNAFNDVVKDENTRTVMFNFSLWRALADSESMHLGRMLANEALKGYISTTRAISVAKGFAKAGGWVYLTLVRGGFVVPEKQKHEWTSIFGEQEIALPAPVPWKEIFAFRQIAPAGANKFVGPVYFRRGFEGENPKAFQEAHDLFSGKAQ